MTEKQHPIALQPVSGWGRVSAAVDPFLEQIIDLYIDGFTLRQIVDMLKLPLTASQVRMAFENNWPERWDEARIARSHELIERNLEHAIAAAKTGEASGYKAAADINFKIAALLNHDDYGDKKRVELTGKNGGAIETKADLTVSPDEAYKRMLGGEQ